MKILGAQAAARNMYQGNMNSSSREMSKVRKSQYFTKLLHSSRCTKVAISHPVFAILARTAECLGWKIALDLDVLTGPVECCGRYSHSPKNPALQLFQYPGTCVQYPGLQGAGALGEASTPGTPAGFMTANAHGGTYIHVGVVRGAWAGERGAASATAAAATRRRRATPTGGAVTPPHSAPAHGGRGGRHGARAGGWDRPPRDRAPLTALLDGVSHRRRAAATEASAQAPSPAGDRGRVESRKSLRAVAARNSGRWGGHGGRRRPGPLTRIRRKQGPCTNVEADSTTKSAVEERAYSAPCRHWRGVRQVCLKVVCEGYP